jgi:hypothetical protein
MPTGKPMLLHSQVSDPGGGTGEMGEKAVALLQSEAIIGLEDDQLRETTERKKKAERRKKIEAISDKDKKQCRYYYFFFVRRGRKEQSKASQR